MAGSSRLVVVDTSVVVAIFRFDAETVQRLALAHLLISTVVLGELYYGAYGATRQKIQLTKIDDVVALSTVVTLTKETTQHYGHIKQLLRSRGLLIPENDIWIAAIALEHELPLATRDAHFERVPGLVVERW